MTLTAPHSIVQDGKLLPAALEAKKRGVGMRMWQAGCCVT